MTQQVHFIGLGGIGMSGLARILCQKGAIVSGSDMRGSEVTRALVRMGARFCEGHVASNVAAGSTVVFSTQVKQDNVEYQAAVKMGCPLWHRSQLLANLMEGKLPLAVAGTHGKTTTTSLLTVVLTEAQLDPAYAVGGIVAQLGTNGSWGTGEHFVFEADESDGSFLRYSPHGAIVTNIDDDHLDHYKSKDKLIDAFRTFMKKVPSPQWLFWCGDDPHLRALAMPGVSYGFGADCALCVSNLRCEGWSVVFDIAWEGRLFRDVEVALTGRHNALNAAAVFGMATRLGIAEGVIRRALSTFSGVGRRCEKKGVYDDVLVIDDYGHHPTEISVTLQALRRADPSRRLVVAFQPHRYSRTIQCLDSFGPAFRDADVLFITEIYAAMEAPIPGVDSSLIVAEVGKVCDVPCYQVQRSSIVKALASFVRPGDLVVTLGAGDITKVGPELLAALSSRPCTQQICC